MAWSDSFGIRTTRGPVRTPPDLDKGILARVCVPVRHAGILALARTRYGRYVYAVGGNAGGRPADRRPRPLDRGQRVRARGARRGPRGRPARVALHLRHALG